MKCPYCGGEMAAGTVKSYHMYRTRWVAEEASAEKKSLRQRLRDLWALG